MGNKYTYVPLNWMPNADESRNLADKSEFFFFPPTARPFDYN